MKNERNLVLGILAHVDAGKTTLSEAMLYLAGKLKKLGRVDHRDSFLDTHALERQREGSIIATASWIPMRLSASAVSPSSPSRPSCRWERGA